MPKRTDIKKILVIGSGPIVIGQACEFDYSGTQGCKALRSQGYEVVLVNSNPATIMTDPAFGDRTYVEPLTPAVLRLVIERERPQALLPTLGGQTALNLAMDLHHAGVLQELGVEMIGANAEAIHRAEDRHAFKEAMLALGLDVPRSGIAHTMDEALAVADQLGGEFPLVIRPAFTLGGTGGGIAFNMKEYRHIVENGLRLSPVSEVLVEESVLGWKEFELEVMRDRADNFVVICSIENLDPMGVHTGDSITVAPAQTLTDREYQAMRDDARRIIRAVGVETGGSNIQFAVDPRTGRRVVIEMNPRVSRSSALASKATGFPIAKIAALLAVGYTLDELPNDITKATPACFEPTIDYCVVKIPRFAFEKFQGASPVLGTSMKSVGETMAIGRTFREALQKAMRGLELGRFGLGGDGKDVQIAAGAPINISTPTPDRLLNLKYALERGASIESVAAESTVDPWFLAQMAELIALEAEVRGHAGLHAAVAAVRQGRSISDPAGIEPFLFRLKQNGFSDRQIGFQVACGLLGVDAARAEALGSWETAVRTLRHQLGIRPAYKCVDTCGGEFRAQTPYFYSTYERESEAVPSNKPKVIILGGGPNRIGQGIEFDYCCVQAVFALRGAGFETIMVNSNPETVSTDYDTSDKLYFEPLTAEDVIEICKLEKPTGVLCQFGGQTPLNLIKALAAEGIPILGTSADSVDLAENRARFGDLITRLGLRQPENGSGTTFEQVRDIAAAIGYPVVVRPSYVLGGRAMRIVYSEESLREYIREAAVVSDGHPVLVDRFLTQAAEVDVDAVCDGQNVVVAAIMEHIEAAGVHSGDSACMIPSRSLTPKVLDDIREATRALGVALKVRGLMNIQFAVKDGEVSVLEVNPRASRTVPYVSKVIGVPIAQLAALISVGKTLPELGFTEEPEVPYDAVKEVVLPFLRFPGAEIDLGPEMRSTGEVMGIDEDFPSAFLKASLAAGLALPQSGGAFISIADEDKASFVEVARQLAQMGFRLSATPGTARFLQKHGLEAKAVRKISEGRPHVVDLMINGEVQLVVNTKSGARTDRDEQEIRSESIRRQIPLLTTVAAASAAAIAIDRLRSGGMRVRSLQEYHADLAAARS